MSEHYSGHDPETGCGWLMVALVLGAIIVILGIAVFVKLIP